MAEGDALARMKHRYDEDASFRTMEWAVKLPVIRTAKGHVDHLLHRVAVVLALHADGRTGENAHPSQKTIAQHCGADSLSTVADALARGEALGLWEADEDMSRWNTTQWHLAIEDDQLIERLENAELTREEHKRQQKADQWSRYKARQGQSTGTAPKKARRVSGQAPQGQSTSTAGSVDRHRSSSGQVPQGLPGLDNQPSMTSPRDLPSVDLPVGTATSPAAPGDGPVVARRPFDRGGRTSLAESTPVPDDDMADRLMDLVLPRLSLDETQTRKAHTVLMKFAARWSNAMEITELAIELAPQYEGELELGCFEEKNDGDFAVPLSKKIEEFTKETQ